MLEKEKYDAAAAAQHLQEKEEEDDMGHSADVLQSNNMFTHRQSNRSPLEENQKSQDKQFYQSNRCVVDEKLGSAVLNQGQIQNDTKIDYSTVNKSESVIDPLCTKQTPDLNKTTLETSSQENIGVTKHASVVMKVKSENETITDDSIIQLFNDTLSDNSQRNLDAETDNAEYQTKCNNRSDIQAEGASCPICKMVLGTKIKLNYHMRKFHISEPVCYLCGNILISIEGLRTHLKRVHNQEFYHMKPEHASANTVSIL